MYDLSLLVYPVALSIAVSPSWSVHCKIKSVKTMSKSNNIYSLNAAARNNVDISEEEILLLPCLFQHSDLVSSLDSARVIEKKKFAITLNHIHFTGGHVFFHLTDQRYGDDILIRAFPEPCLEDSITFRWSNHDFSRIRNYQFRHLIIVDGLSVTVAPVQVGRLCETDFSIDFPQKVYSVGKRQARRYTCRSVLCELNQSGMMAQGTLVDFSPLAFRIKVTPDPHSSFLWFNARGQITISLFRNQEIVFAGLCRCVRETFNLAEKELVLSPVNSQISRFKKKSGRNPRVHLRPPAYVTFTHPLFNKATRLDVHDISISGFSVRENADESVLIPGMIIPRLNITFSGSLKITCKAQVIFRRNEKKGYYRCGFAFLDMDIVTYRQLSNIVTNSIDTNIHISDDIDVDALWEFFFNTGFIYPKKYDLIQENTDAFKETYKRLYQDKPEIAMHITYQNNGVIYGHASMVRAYDRAWMFHHLAARPVGKRHTGLPVLRQILHYLSGLNYLPSVQFNYLMFYFRPENRFPNFFFGDLVRDFKDPRRCSLDLFSYISYRKQTASPQLPDGWCLKRSTLPEILDFERFYQYRSGGLLIDALGMKQQFPVNESLEKIYERNGLLRKWETYTLLNGDRVMALLIVNQSNMGLNLAEILNNITVCLCGHDDLPWEVLCSAIENVIGTYKTESVPLMIFPHTYLEDKGISSEKDYLLWLADIQYGPEYLEYMRNKMKMKLRFLLKFVVKTYLKR